MDRDLDSEAVESFTQDVVNCIRQFIDALRAEFPVTKQPLAAILQTSTKSPLLYTRLVERGIRKQVLETIKNQKELLGCGEFENITTAATLESSSANDLEGERYRLVHEILLPLIHSLSECYKILDQLPQPQPPQREEQTRRRNKAKPIPPKGMLSLQNYTDIACLLEFTICTSVLPILEPFVLISTEDRIRYHLPKSLAGRIPRNSLAWGAAQEKLTVKVTGNENLQQKQSRELIQTASVVATLVLLDRFRPMLLPRHAPDVYAAFFQAEHSMGYDYIKQQRQQYNIYNKLGLSLQHTQNMDAMLQAKAYQTLLLQGTKGPSWIRERVAPLLTELACKNLVAIVQVFVPLQEPSMASQRLGRALATSSSSPKTKPVASSLCRQMLGLLEVIFPKEGEIPAKAMAILQTIWAVLYEWPVEVVQNELIRVWEQGVLNSDGGKASTIHATIRQIGALCSFVPPSTMNPLSVVRWLFVPNRTMKKSIFFHLVRVASMPSILESTARNDARQTLQWLSHAMHSCNRTNEQANVRLVMNQGREEVVISGPDLLVSAWLHAIAPSSWDLAGNTYSPSSGAAPSAPNRGTMGPISALEKVEIRLQQDKNQIVDNIAGDCSKRAEVFVETIVMTCCRPEEECAPTEGKKESLSPTGMRGMPSRLFRLLLRVYLSSADIETKASKLGGGVQLAAISLIPILCEKCTPESLLFDDNENAIGLLRLIKLVLTCTKSRFENQARDAATLNAGYYDDEDEMITCLEQFVCLSLNEDSNIGELPPLLAGNDFEQDSTVLSIASIILSLLIAVLELGSKLRSVEEEEMLKSFLPVLQTLADFTDIVANASDSSFSFQNSNAGLADMAGYALALLASRQAPIKEKVPVEAIPFSTIEKLRKIIEEAEEDLGSTQPPLRARGMVSLGRLARGYLGIVPQEKVPFVVELDQAGPREEDPIAVLVQEVLRLSMVALSDSESYVYLAAVQTIVAIGDMRPRDVLPKVATAVVTGGLKTGKAAGSSSPTDIQLSLEQRIKLAEALMFVIRRRAATDEFIQILVNIMVFGSVERIGSQPGPQKGVVGQDLLQEETHKYFFRLDRQEDVEEETQEEKWEEQDIRLKTGGPMFTMEEADVVRSARVSVLAELVSASKPSSVAPHCDLLLRLVIDVLRLDSSRTVCRAASLLARELYASVIREQDELAEALNGPQDQSVNPLPVAVALISSDEDLLLSSLQNHASSRGDESERRVHDPTTTVRCKEAIRLREQAEKTGILTAARLILSQGKLNHIPNILTSFRQNQSRIIEIDREKSIG